MYVTLYPHRDFTGIRESLNAMKQWGWKKRYLWIVLALPSLYAIFKGVLIEKMNIENFHRKYHILEKKVTLQRDSPCSRERETSINAKLSFIIQTNYCIQRHQSYYEWFTLQLCMLIFQISFSFVFASWTITILNIWCIVHVDYG